MKTAKSRYNITADEAGKILGIEHYKVPAEERLELVKLIEQVLSFHSCNQKNHKHLFKQNQEGGSQYLQAKVEIARLRLLEELQVELKDIEEMMKPPKQIENKTPDASSPP